MLGLVLVRNYNIVCKSDIVNKKESAGRAAAVGNIDCGSREALRSESPQENASYFRTVL